MLSRPINTSLPKRKIIKNIPGDKEGSTGDIQIAEIPGKGTFLCIKDRDGWKISDVFKQRHKFNKTEFDKIKATSIFGKSGRVLTLGTDLVSYTVYSDPNTSSTTTFNRPILKVGDASNAGVISSNGSKDLLLKSGYSSTSSLAISGNEISASMNSTGTFTITYNDTGATSGEFSMMNVAAGDCYQNIQVKNGAKDPYTRYSFYADSPSNNKQWCVGMDGDDTDAFKINYNASATALTPSNGTNFFKITSAGRVIIAATKGLYFDGGTHTYITESSDDVLKFYVGGVVMLTLTEASSDSSLFSGSVGITSTNKLLFDGTLALGHTYIQESSDDTLDFYVGTDRMLRLDESADKISMAATNWVAGTVSGTTVTEFSAANSAYAGMILGYTDIGLDEGRVSYTMTTSYVVPTDEFGVTFVAPPSGNVEIMVSFRYNAGGNGLGDLYVGLSDANATSGYNAVEDFHEELIRDGMGRDELTTIQNYWTLTGLTAGTSYTRWLGVKSSNLIGSPTLEYGGSATGHNPDFIMKATALPATIAT